MKLFFFIAQLLDCVLFVAYLVAFGRKKYSSAYRFPIVLMLFGGSICCLWGGMFWWGSAAMVYCLFGHVFFSLLMFFFAGRRIVLTGDYIEKKQFLIETIQYPISEITSIYYGYDIEITIEGRVLKITNGMRNRDLMFTQLCRSVNKKCRIRRIKQRVRKLNMSVTRPGNVYFILILSILLEIGMIAFFILTWNLWKDHIPMVLLFVVPFPVFDWFLIHSVKRAHSSAFWGRMARLCLRVWMLKDLKKEDIEIIQ